MVLGKGEQMLSTHTTASLILSGTALVCRSVGYTVGNFQSDDENKQQQTNKQKTFG